MGSELTMAPEKPEAPSSPSAPTSPCKTGGQRFNPKLNNKEHLMNFMLFSRTSSFNFATNEGGLVWTL